MSPPPDSAKEAWAKYGAAQIEEWLANPQSTYFEHRFAVASFDLGFYFWIRAFLHPSEFRRWFKIGVGKALCFGQLPTENSVSLCDAPTRENSVALVVTFNPDEKIIQNIHLLKNEFENLWIVDNSPEAQSPLLKDFVRVFYHGNQNGLSGALNLGLRATLAKQKSGWIFFFDQDSKIYGSFLQKTTHTLKDDPTAEWGNSIYSVDYDDEKTELKVNWKSPIHEASTVITSGSFTRLENIRRLGPFIDELFIDSIDHEYSLRARRFGMKVKRIRTRLMVHSLGEIKLQRFLCKRDVVTTNHAPFRWYYFARNFFFVSFEGFPTSLPWFFEHGYAFLKIFVKMLLFEDQKIRKTSNVIRGMFAALRLFFRGQSRHL